MLTIEYCGYHTHNPDHDLIYRPSGTLSYLFLLVLSPMTFYFPDGTCQAARPGACILYAPGVYQHYQAEKEFFNSYVHFFSNGTNLSNEAVSSNENILSGKTLRINRLFYPDSADRLNWLIKQIYHEYLNHTADSEEMTDLYLHQLLILLQRDQRRESIPAEQRSGIYPELLALREQMLSSCERPWAVEQLCDILNIGKSQLYQYYRRFFHSSPKEDLIQARLQKARYLMTNSNVTIQQAAFDSGFQNICHFNRQFKLHCGCTPGEYRNSLQGR